MCRVERITKNKREYMDILLVADPSERAIAQYLDDSDLFVMFDEDEPVCAAAVLRASPAGAGGARCIALQPLLLPRYTGCLALPCQILLVPQSLLL